MGLDFKSHIVQLKIVILILAPVTVVLGCYSHFTSSWLTMDISRLEAGYDRPYQVCKDPDAEKCPDIAMERWFVSIVIISLILSVGVLILTAHVDMSNLMYRKMDAIYHGLAGVSLIVAAIFYFRSAEQIHDFVGGSDLPEDWHLRRTEKLVSAVIAIVQGALCLVNCIFIMNTNRVK